MLPGPTSKRYEKRDSALYPRNRLACAIVTLRRKSRITHWESIGLRNDSLLLLTLPSSPRDYLEIQHRKAVQDRHEQKRDKLRNRKPSDLSEAQRLPERSSMAGEWEERQDGCANRD